tara:strand:+ start:9435 stop:10556 length:1122 start_codon:yes stop_codon:yes gene_type:complete
MKIILFFTYGISLFDWKNTGLLNREVKFYEELYKKYNISVTFVTFGDNTDLKIVENKEFIKVVPLYSLIKYDNNKFIRLIRSLVCYLKLSQIINEADVLKTNQLLGSWIAIFSKIKYKKPLIVRTGYDLFTFSRKNKKANYKVLIYKQLTKLALKFADIYLISSNTDKEFLSKLYPKYKNKLKVRFNWVEIIKNKEFELRHKHKIISVGRLEKQKNYELLINKLEDSTFVLDIYGDGTEKDNLFELSQHKNVKLNIFNPISNEDLLIELTSYRVFISSSTFEGNPKAILEAMAAGCVVIAKNNLNISEIIENNSNGILYEENEKLSEIIENILSNKDDWIRISNNAIKAIKENNLLENIIKDEYSDLNKLYYS